MRHLTVVTLVGFDGKLVQGIPFVCKLPGIHALHLVSETAGIRLLESVIAQGYDKFLAGEIDVLQLKGGVPVFLGVGLLIVGPVEKGEREVVLVPAHLHEGGIGKCQGSVAFVGTVVVNHHAVHHAALVILAVHAQDVAVDAVVEGSGRDFYFVLGASDIVAERINLIESLGHQIVADEIRADAYQHG